MTVLMTPEMANFSGKVHGGAVLRLLDQVAYACASRYAGNYVVTLSVDQVMFRQPIAVGELVTFLASVNYTGTLVDGGGHQGGGRGHPQGQRAPRQQLLLHHGRGGRRRQAHAGAAGAAAAAGDRRRDASLCRAQIRRQLRQDMEQRHRELLGSSPAPATQTRSP